MAIRCFFAALFALALLATPVSASELTEWECADLDAVTNTLVIKELDLIALTARLKSKSVERSAWRGRRWSAYSIANGSLTSVGALANSVERLKNIESPRQVSRSALQKAALLRLSANLLSIGGVVTECTLDSVDGLKQKHRGTDIAALKKTGDTLVRDVETLLKQRDDIIKADAQYAVDAIRAETAILKDIGKIASNDFIQCYAQARGKETRVRSAYLLTGASNAVSFAGTLTGIVATRRRRLKLGGTGGVADLISASINIGTPAVTRLCGITYQKWLRQRENNAVKPEEKVTLATLSDRIKALDETIEETNTNVSSGIQGRRAVLEEGYQILSKRQQQDEKERVSAKYKLVENQINAITGGGAKLTQGIGTLVGTYRYSDDASKRLQMTGSCSLVYGIGTSVATAETIRNQLSFEIHNFKAQKARRRSSQVLAEQLERIDALKARLGTSSNAGLAASDSSITQ